MDILGLLLAKTLTIEQKVRLTETIIDGPPPAIPSVVSEICGEYTRTILNAVQEAENDYRSKTNDHAYLRFAFCRSYAHVFALYTEATMDKALGPSSMPLLLKIQNALNMDMHVTIGARLHLLVKYYMFDAQGKITMLLIGCQAVSQMQQGEFPLEALISSIKSAFAASTPSPAQLQ